MRGHVEVCAALLLRPGASPAAAAASASALTAARNAQGQTPVDLAQPQWSLSWRFVKELLEGGKGSQKAGGERLGLAAAIPSSLSVPAAEAVGGTTKAAAP